MNCFPKRIADLQLRRSIGTAVIHLSDTGIGFGQETKKHLFERFYRANQEDVQESPGSGLGLSLVKAIVDLAPWLADLIKFHPFRWCVPVARSGRSRNHPNSL